MECNLIKASVDIKNLKSSTIKILSTKATDLQNKIPQLELEISNLTSDQDLDSKYTDLIKKAKDLIHIQAELYAQQNFNSLKFWKPNQKEELYRQYTDQVHILGWGVPFLSLFPFSR